ncbi:DUF1738 domain-containing protein [Helicobacter sp. MIT 11-5569]|uniref:ArdC-like ssDNA-binding domain-containing protein n=1 Tax=Helicobacter sp. MIT 11-5569 TaxID=1548151 RepID=UPI00051FEB34|nr:ArdC-like ssDNA-binding domain-containing protein [Helicobacter sp. MIT 11-5569]TLD85187.1 DUF1738 domain-containing protein [Helicobacter sp. MIT 11-5569]
MENKENVTENKETKKWEEMDNSERLDFVNKKKRILVAMAMSEKNIGKMFWNKEMDTKDIEKTMPYNKATGKPFLGLNGVLMRAFADVNGYKSNEFISAKQVFELGGEIKTYPIFDKEGNPVLDDKGEQICKGKSFQYEYLADFGMQPKIDPKTNEPMKAISQEGREYIVKERVDYPTPKLETTNLYHISEIKGIDKSKLKSLDLTNLPDYRQKLAEQIRSTLPNLQKLGITGMAQSTIMRFLNAQNKGENYIPTLSQKQVAEKYKQNEIATKAKENPKAQSRGM